MLRTAWLDRLAYLWSLPFGYILSFKTLPGLFHSFGLSVNELATSNFQTELTGE